MFLLFEAWFVVGCGQIESDQIDQEEIYTDYQGTYNEESGVFKVSARFSVGGSFGTQVWLSEKSGIFVNGIKLAGDDDLFNLIQYKYESLKYPEEFPSTFDLRYQNEKDRNYENKMEMPGRVRFVVDHEISRNHGGVIEWRLSDSKLGDERLEIELSDREGKKFIIGEAITDFSGTTRIEPEFIEGFDGDLLFVTVCRKRRAKKVVAPTIGGNMSMTYCSRKINSRITDVDNE